MGLCMIGRKPQTKDASSSTQDAENAPSREDILELKGLDTLLQSILTKQGIHNGDLRSALRSQERLESSVERVIGKLNSIEETLRGVDRNGRGLVELLKARPESS